jgi:hypothetical protein
MTKSFANGITTFPLKSFIMPLPEDILDNLEGI